MQTPWLIKLKCVFHEEALGDWLMLQVVMIDALHKSFPPWFSPAWDVLAK